MKEVNQYLTGKALTGKKLNKVKGIVVHWFADPMAKATNVIKYWQSQADGVSAHDVICLDGTLYHAVPYNMEAYQVGCPRGYTPAAVSKLSSYPNDCVVGIECAHLDMTGKMTPETYNTLVQQVAKLINQFGLTVNNIWLHSEIVGKDYKDCHRWFTTTKPEDWTKFKEDVLAVLNPPKPSQQSIKQIGTVTVLSTATPYVNIRKEPSASSEDVGNVYPNKEYKCYGSKQVNGVTWYNVGCGWVIGTYVKFSPMA